MSPEYHFDWRKGFFILLGLFAFFLVHFMAPWADAVDPSGKAFALTREGKGAVGLFLMAGIWWVFEVMPIGITSIAIGVFQALFRIRSANDAFRDFMDPSVLFSGAMSLGFCLWKTGAAQWIAVKWIGMFQHSHWLVFVLGVAALVLVMTNFIMNVAAIAISLPVSLVIARYLGISPELIMYASLVTAGMPFVLLIGAAPNAIAYESRQFNAGEFFATGVPASLVLLAVLTLALTVLWPLLGMVRFITP